MFCFFHRSVLGCICWIKSLNPLSLCCGFFSCLISDRLAEKPAHQKKNGYSFQCEISFQMIRKLNTFLFNLWSVQFKCRSVFFSLVPAADQFVCRTEAIADIVILVDGSWSIGRLNFRLVRMFLENLVDAFDIGIDKTRIGGSVYFRNRWLRHGTSWFRQYNLYKFCTCQCIPRSGSVQWRSQDWVASQHIFHERCRHWCSQEPALQRRKHTHWYLILHNHSLHNKYLYT